MFWVKFSVGQNILMWTMQIMADDEQYNQHITTRKIGKNMRKIQAIEYIQCGQVGQFGTIS